MRLVITVDCSDDSDLDWLKHKCIGAVEDEIETMKAEERNDGNIELDWDIED